MVAFSHPPLAGAVLGADGFPVARVGHPSVRPWASHLPCPGEDEGFAAAVATKSGQAADGKAWRRPALWTAIEVGKRAVGFPPSSQRMLGSLFPFRRFVRRSEIPAFAGMTAVGGNKRSDAELLSGCADGEWWLSVILPLQGRCWGRTVSR